MKDIKKTLVEACLAGGEVISYYFGNVVAYEMKDDNSPVSDADKQADEQIIRVIKKRTA